MRQRPKPFLLLALATLLVFVAGCGDKSSGGKIDNPRAEALSYIPRDAPATVEITTDPKSEQIGNALALIRRFPFGGVLLTGIETDLERQGPSYEQDIKPLLGNPFVISPLILPGGGDTGFLIAFVAKDSGKLSDLVKKNASKVGDHGGFTIYRSKSSDSSAAAVKGPVFLLSRDQPALEAAIDRHAADQGVRASDIDALSDGLPGQALLRVSGNVGALIDRAATPKAKLVPFVRALKGYALTLSASSEGLAMDVRLDTSGESLGADDQPLPSGDNLPPLGSRAPINGGVQDPAHAIRFLIGIGKVLDPQGYTVFLRDLADLKKRTGVDLLKELSSQLSGEAQIAGASSSVAVRAKATDPAALRRDLVKLRPFIADLLDHARAEPGPSGLTVFRGDSDTLTLGVVGDQLVVGTASPADLVSFAGEPLTPLAGAKGTAAMRLNLKAVLGPVLSLFAGQGTTGQIAQGALDRLGEVTAYASEDGKALTAHLALGVR